MERSVRMVTVAAYLTQLTADDGQSLNYGVMTEVDCVVSEPAGGIAVDGAAVEVWDLVRLISVQRMMWH